MKDPRDKSDDSIRHRRADLVANDLQALGAESERDVPSIHKTSQVFNRLPHAREGLIMSTLRSWNTRRWWLPVGAAAAIALGLLFVPVSYQQTVGQTVTLTIEDGQFDGASMRQIADAFSASMGAESMSIRAGKDLVLEAGIPVASSAEARLMAAAFVSALEEKGLQATTEITPITETISGNAYAYAANLASDIRVSTAGRSEFEVENDLRQQLQAAGFLNPDVQFSRNGEETKLTISAEEPDGGQYHVEMHQVIKGDGAAGGEEPDIELMLMDPEQLKGKSDAEIKAIVEQQLRDRGITDVTVSVKDGECRVEVKHEETR